MAPKGRQALETWHQEQRNKEVVFNFQKELGDYCKIGPASLEGRLFDLQTVV